MPNLSAVTQNNDAAPKMDDLFDGIEWDDGWEKLWQKNNK